MDHRLKKKFISGLQQWVTRRDGSGRNLYPCYLIRIHGGNSVTGRRQRWAWGEGRKSQEEAKVCNGGQEQVEGGRPRAGEHDNGDSWPRVGTRTECWLASGWGGWHAPGEYERVTCAFIPDLISLITQQFLSEKSWWREKHKQVFFHHYSANKKHSMFSK